MNRTIGRRLVAGLLAVTALAAVAPAAEAKKAKAKASDSHVSVMTRNLYLGTDLIKIATAPNLDAFKAAVTAGFDQVKATNFPARSKLIAKEIKRTKPDVIGLQEAALWRTGPSDGSTTPNATKVEYDYVKLLTKALKQVGLDYAVVRSTNEADIEGASSGGFDVRLTMRDAILVNKARKGLKVVKKGGANFAATIPFPTQGGIFNVKRGYAWADMKLNGKKFRFVDTHLEAYLEATRVAQAKELVAAGGPVKGKRVIVVGDMNSDPNNAGGSPPGAWDVLTASGLKDTWPWLYKSKPGYECCLKTDSLTDPPSPSPFDHRIDQIFGKGKLKPLNAKIVGTNPANSRTKSGLWASDHGGVVTKLKLK
jgi:endonuclease/exonuclease/phosphatase family metal-dependent hydrolase